MENQTVFISYSHDSDEHKEQVLGFSERLRADGIHTLLDRYVKGNSPVEGWPRWMMDRLDEAQFVLVVCTEKYYRRFRGREKPGTGKGANWEGALITQEIYDSCCRNQKFIPVYFSADDAQYVPEILRSQTHYLLSSFQNYKELYHVLLGNGGVVPAPLGPVKPTQRTECVPLRFFDEPAEADIEPNECQEESAGISPTSYVSPDLLEKDRQFLNNICDSLRRDLSQRTDLLEMFRKECSVPTTGTDVEFVEYMVRECEQENFDEIILHLQDAFTKCWSLVSSKEHLHLLHITKRLFAKLVLFNVRVDWFKECREQTGNGGCSIWSFPEMDSEQLSVAIARRGQFIPSFTRVSGRHRLDGDLTNILDGIEHGMNKDNKALSSILRLLAARLAPYYDATGKSEAEIVQYIKTRLDRHRRKSDIDERKHFFLMLPARQQGSSLLADPSILEQVQRWLPELGWVRLQSGKSQPLFMIASHDYLATFHDFFETIQAKEAELA